MFMLVNGWIMEVKLVKHPFLNGGDKPFGVIFYTQFSPRKR